MARDFARQLARGKITERQVAEYLKALGYFVLPTTDFSARGAPRLEGASASLVMPDLQAFTRGVGEWWEAKLKSQASPTDRFAGRLVTGIDALAWVRYCDVEHETAMPVVIVFVHEKEQEVRCGTLHQLHEVESHRTDRMGKGGMINFRYDEVPLWMSYDELRANVVAQQLDAKLIAPSPPPIVRQLLRQSHAIRRHGFAREIAQQRDAFVERKPPWTWACLCCNYAGDSATHDCKPQDWLRGMWTARVRWALPSASAEEVSSLVDKPIERSRLVTILGPQWAADGDAA